MRMEEMETFGAGLDFTADGPISGQRQDERQNTQADKPTRGFDQSRDGHREMAQTGLENPNPSPSTSGAGDAVYATRAMGEERERVGFSVLMADDSSMGMRIGILEERRGRQRRRQSDDNPQDDMASSSDQPGGYVVATQGTTTASKE